MSVLVESSLADSVLFKSVNTNAEMTNLISKCIKDSILMDPSYIEEQLMQIKRTRISPLCDAVLDAYNKKDIVILYSNVLKVPQAIPFTVIKVQGKLKAFIFVNNYGTLSDKGRAGGGKYLNMPMKDLYVLMEGAYTALQYYQYPSIIAKDLALSKICAQIYSSMALRIFNKDYALSMDPESYNRVAFCLGKFFLERIWGSINEDINTSYAMQCVINPNKTDLAIVNESYNEAHIETIENLINFLKQLSPRLAKLSFRFYTHEYINTYKPGSLFSMECLPYFLYVVECTMIGSFLVNQPIIHDLLKDVKGIKNFYIELNRIM